MSPTGPNKFLYRHQWSGENGRGKQFSQMGVNARRAPELVMGIEGFRTLARAVKEKKGWTWKQMAEAGGWQPGHLSCYMFDKKREVIGREAAVGFFERVSGKATEPTSWQKKEFARLQKKDADFERSLVRSGPRKKDGEMDE